MRKKMRKKFKVGDVVVLEEDFTLLRNHNILHGEVSLFENDGILSMSCKCGRMLWKRNVLFMKLKKIGVL